MTTSEAAYQSAKQKEQAAVQACTAAYPAPWLMIHGHIELIISADPAPEVRLIVFPPSTPLNVGEVGIEVGASATIGRQVKSEAFHGTSEAPAELPVDRVGYLIAEAIVARPGAVDLTKIPKWAKAATIEALTPHRERIKQAQDVLKGKVK